MKRHFINIGIIILLVMVSCTFSKTLPETIQKITRKLQSKDFTIKANYAIPLRGKQFYLTSDYDLRIKNDSAVAYLPYFGVAHVAPYNSSEGGIKFAEPMIDYSMVSNKKKNGWDIRFKIKAKEYNYDFFVTIFNNGSSSFTVSSYQRDAITFNGEIKN